MLTRLSRLLPGLGLILAAWAAGNGLTAALHLPLPAAMTGLGLLFLSFVCFPRLAQIAGPAAELLLGLLPLFLYPFAAGFLDLPAISLSEQIRLLLVVLVSLLATMVTAVLLFRRLRRHDI